MFENIMAHIDTILIIITLVSGYRLLKSDLTEIINQSHKGLKEEIKKCEDRLNNRLDETTANIKEVDKKTNEVSNKVSHIEGRLDQLFPPGVNKTAA